MAYTGPFPITFTATTTAIVVNTTSFSGILANTGMITPNGITVENSSIGGTIENYIGGAIAGGITVENASTINGTINGGEAIVNDQGTIAGGITVENSTIVGIIQDNQGTIAGAITVENASTGTIEDFQGTITGGITVENASTINGTIEDHKGGNIAGGIVIADAASKIIAGAGLDGIVISSVALFGSANPGGGITNNGSISSANDGIGVFDVTTQFAGGISNGGTISANNHGISVSTVAQFGNTSPGGGITNSGTISTTVDSGINIRNDTTFTGSIDNSGKISAGGYYGIFLDNVSQFGTARAGGGIVNTGVISETTATGPVTGTGIYVLSTNSFAGGISNSGTISGAIDGIDLDIVSTFLGGVSNTGTISGAVGIRVNAAPGVSVFDSGKIVGSGGTAVTFSDSTDALTLGPGYSISGNVLGAGSNVFQLGGAGSGSFNLGLIGAQYTGFSTFEVVGASWDVTGAGNEAWTLEGGTLELGVGGSIADNVTFAGMATLQLDSGTNQLGADIAGAAPGDAIDLRFQTFASGDKAVWQPNGATGTLSLETSSNTVLDTLTLSGQFTSNNFLAQTDNNGGTLVEVVNAPPPGPPTVTAGATVTYTGGGAAVTLDSALTVSDPESGTLVGATVAIGAGFFLGDTLNFTNQNGIAGTYNATTGALTLSGIASVANYQVALESVTFSSTGNPSDWDTDLSRTVSWTVNDGTLSSNTATSTINITAPPPSPTPNGTTADMILSNGANGDYVIFDIGGNSILAASPLGQIAPEWQVAGLGGFFGTDTTDMMLRDSNNAAVEVYDISNNAVTSVAVMGAIGPEWTVAGFGDFSGNANETDMIMRATIGPDAGDFGIFDISNNSITSFTAIPGIPSALTVAGFGDFSGNANETDMMLRNNTTGQFYVYDISHNVLTSSAFIGTVGPEWTVAGFGDFSSNANETDMLLRNSTTGAFEVYDISHNALGLAASIGVIGTAWTVAGFGDISGNPGESDMLMRNSSTGAFEVYDISHNALSSAAPMGSVGLDWTVDGIAADPPSGASGASMGPLVAASSLHPH